ncbi:hypothetical protein [Paenibacillus radicis (ex Gao et al. 2016)]|nr:hypothetical protein [Paenibacillus radicis (ex Gao et al. 2016)]
MLRSELAWERNGGKRQRLLVHHYGKASVIGHQAGQDQYEGPAN